ncbi:hypothetical protein ACTJJ4_01825 [Microbacterium sp. 22195]|uniref:hypothetical protein n=1 Tax=Microbacterium sp. 22195 TaxID=3453891 RepID=UPI003F83A076
MENVEEQHPESLFGLVPGAHRLIRRLDGGESPFTGDLVSDGEQRRVLIDAAVTEAALWEFADAEHVAGVQDLVRSADGHGALLPWCVEPAETLIARRCAAGRPLTSGEIVTLVGSLMRGIVEVAGRPITGRWWLEDGGRPVFVPGEGLSCAAASLALVERVRDECADRAMQRMLARIAVGMADHRMVLRELDAWEGELTELAAPRALEREAAEADASWPAPERVRALSFHRAGLAEVAGRLEERRSLRERLVLVGARLHERLRESIPSSKPRMSSGVEAGVDGGARTRAPRGRMLLVGAGAAALVILGGLLWPGGDEDAVMPQAVAADRQASPSPSASELGQVTQPDEPRPSESGAPAPEQPRPDREDGDVERTATRLLKAIDGCRAKNDTDCATAIVAGGAQGVLERLGADAAGREVTLVEDYGDIAVTRLGRTATSGEQMLVLVREKDGWLVRDVYDVADQPSGGD